MKVVKLATLFLSFLLLTNCGKEDAPENEIPKEQEEPKKEEPKAPETVTYLKFNSNLDQSTDHTDDYIVVHDQNGKLLGHQSFEKGDNLVFQTMDTSLVGATSLTMSVIQTSNFLDTRNHEVQSYTEIEIGSELYPAVPDIVVSKASGNTLNTFKSTNSRTKSLASKDKGAFNLTVTNTNGVARYAISNDVFGPGKIEFMPQEIDSLVLNDFQLQKDERYLISLEDLDGNYRYQFFDVPNVDGKIDLDFNTFLEFDRLLEVTLPSHQSSSGSSLGFNSAENLYGRSFEMSFHAEQGETENVRFGYIDSFEYYGTLLYVKVNSEFEYFYTEYGADIPAQIEVIDQPSITISDNSLVNFQFETAVSYLRSEAVWFYWNQNANDLSISTSWRVHAAPGKQPIIGKLPEQIVEKHPLFNLEKLTHQKTELMTQGAKYEDYIKTRFGQEASPQERIIERIILR